MTDILIHRRGGSDTIDADCDGAFAVHESIWADEGRRKWVVTHVPTGWACFWTRTKRTAIAARAEFLASGLDWSFADPQALTAEHKRVGKALRKKYGHVV